MDNNPPELGNKEKLWISGAAGFIASHFWFQLDHKYDLYGCDKYGYASRTDERRHHRIFERDCTFVEDMELELQRSGAKKLLHMASSTHNDNSLMDPLQFYRDNVMGTASVLEAARRQGIERVYVVVTDEVLKHHNPLPSHYLVSTDWPCKLVDRNYNTFYRMLEIDDIWLNWYNPTSPYSSSKACQEMIVNAYRKSYEMDIVIIRPTNVYGPGQYPEKLISKGITDLLSGKKVQVYGEGAQWRDYTYVSDTCDALDLIISQDKPQPLYHIAANDERQNISTVKEILKQLDKSEDLIEYIKDPRGNSHDFSYSLDSSRIRKLGWAPKVPFEEGIARTIAWYKDQLNGRKD